jgi:predicted nucleic acid-binding Zn ribbon protein
MATTTKATKTFKLSCPECGSAEGLSIDLNDLTSVSCGECSETFSPAEARVKVAEQLRRWEALIAWIGLAGECLAE